MNGSIRVFFGFLSNEPKASTLWATLAFWSLNISLAVTPWADYHAVFLRLNNLFFHFSPRAKIFFSFLSVSEHTSWCLLPESFYGGGRFGYRFSLSSKTVFMKKISSSLPFLPKYFLPQLIMDSSVILFGFFSSPVIRQEVCHPLLHHVNKNYKQSYA